MAVTVAMEVVELATGQVVRRIEILPAHRHPSNVERIERGLLRNLDREKFFVREVYQ